MKLTRTMMKGPEAEYKVQVDQRTAEGNEGKAENRDLPREEIEGKVKEIEQDLGPVVGALAKE